MKIVKLKYSCNTCKKIVHAKHFISEDGRILCYVCRKKENATPANESFKSALGIKQRKL